MARYSGFLSNMSEVITFEVLFGGDFSHDAVAPRYRVGALLFLRYDVGGYVGRLLILRDFFSTRSRPSLFCCFSTDEAWAQPTRSRTTAKPATNHTDSYLMLSGSLDRNPALYFALLYHGG